jgi:nitrate/TMAO reductase-like tetraheme cytochrome c subunit
MIHKPLLLLIASSISLVAYADNDYIRPLSQSKAYQAECASCHMAYQPGLLPAQSWQRIMNNLPNHYGSDASLDSATIKEISTWLIDNAGTYEHVSNPPKDDRITESTWFKRKHRKIGEEVWLRASIKSPAQCMACHSAAANGNYDDDFVKIPK